MRFAGFIMTYERPTILIETINIVLSQTLFPEKLLIVDNSLTNNTEELIKSLDNPKIMYHRIGYNSGPAGAAAIGLKILSDEGYDWIYWGDDDDPPIFIDTFEILLQIANCNPYCGCVGSVGQFFNKTTGFIKRVPNKMLQNQGVIEVDNIAGGMSKIVNGKMISEHHFFPVAKLFFGFEELDFDIKIKKAGYKLLVDKSLYWRHRLKANRINHKRNYFSKKEDGKLNRNYYSVRNTLYICYNNKLYLAFFIQLSKSIFKPFFNLKFGLTYFKKTIQINFLAVNHFFTNRFGISEIK